MANADCRATCSAAGKAAVDSGGSDFQLCMVKDAEYGISYVGELGLGPLVGAAGCKREGGHANSVA